MTKQELARLYNISLSTLRRLLNNRYYEELKAAGYRKTDQIIPPVVIRIFIEIYGPPLNTTDYE